MIPKQSAKTAPQTMGNSSRSNNNNINNNCIGSSNNILGNGKKKGP